MFMTCCTHFTSWRSLRNCRLLESASTTLGTEVKNIGQIVDVRGLSSSFRGVHTVLTSLLAVVKHLQQASGDSSSPPKERDKITLAWKKNLSLYIIDFKTRNEEQTKYRSKLCLTAMKWMQPEVTVVSMCHDSRSFDVTRRQFLNVVVDNMKVCFPDQQFLATGTVLSRPIGLYRWRRVGRLWRQ